MSTGWIEQYSLYSPGTVKRWRWSLFLTVAVANPRGPRTTVASWMKRSRKRQLSVAPRGIDRSGGSKAKLSTTTLPLPSRRANEPAGRRIRLATPRPRHCASVRLTAGGRSRPVKSLRIGYARHDAQPVRRDRRELGRVHCHPVLHVG